jgi:hypothetical protein
LPLDGKSLRAYASDYYDFNILFREQTMTEQEIKPALIYRPSRMELFKDSISLQFKLVIDGFRDFILVPVSLIISIICLVKPGKYPGTSFYHMLRAGKNTGRWINLFSANDKIQLLIVGILL